MGGRLSLTKKKILLNQDHSVFIDAGSPFLSATEELQIIMSNNLNSFSSCTLIIIYYVCHKLVATAVHQQQVLF